MRADAGNSDDYLNDEELAADAAVNDTFLRSLIFSHYTSVADPDPYVFGPPGSDPDP